MAHSPRFERCLAAAGAREPARHLRRRRASIAQGVGDDLAQYGLAWAPPSVFGCPASTGFSRLARALGVATIQPQRPSMPTFSMSLPDLLARLLPALAFAVLCLCGADASAQQERRVALVIGNAAYEEGALRNPVNDAQDMRAKLLRLGFSPGNIVYRENLRTRDIGPTLREFRNKLLAQPGAVALVFYAGHGVQFRGENYLPAVDARIEGEEDVPLQSLHLRGLMDVLAESRSRLNLVFLDACRNNPIKRAFRSGSRGLGRIDAAMPTGTLIAYATRANDVAADGAGRNGVFTSALLQHMESPGQAIEQMLKRVARSVRESSKGAQEPWSEGLIDGDFYFASSTSTGITTGPQLASTRPETALPALDLGDLQRAADEQAVRDRQAVESLNRMQADFDRVAGFAGAPGLQVTAWERFLSAWSADRSTRAGGAALRAQAQQRLEALRREVQPAADLPPQLSVNSNSTFSRGGVRFEVLPTGVFVAAVEPTARTTLAVGDRLVTCGGMGKSGGIAERSAVTDERSAYRCVNYAIKDRKSEAIGLAFKVMRGDSEVAGSLYDPSAESGLPIY